MASNVKRFIDTNFYKVTLLLFVGLFVFNVKTVFAEKFNDKIISVQPPFELTLKKTGRVRLANLLYQADNLSLTKMLRPGDKVKVHVVSDKPDRYARKAVQLYDANGRWVQGELIRQGLAIAYPHKGEERFIRDLYQLEKPHTISALSNDIQRENFAIIKGTVIAVAEVKGTTYLNFGDNWRDDFTIRISKTNKKKFTAFGFDLPTLKGRLLRIRGWVTEQNGPIIGAEHPNQIELLD